MTNSFWEEYEANTFPCENGRHRKHGEVLLRCKMIEPKVLKIIKMISFDPHETIKTCKFIVNLCDLHGITIVATAMPCIVGPSITKNQSFFFGLNQDRLLKFYKHYGFEIKEEDGKFLITRKPKNENHN